MGTLQIRVMPARMSLAWIRGGWRLFARQPLGLCALVALGPVLMLVVSLVPWIGPVVAVAAAPAVSLGMLAACRSIDAGRTPGVAAYTQALAERKVRVELLRLGVYYAVSLAALTGLWSVTGWDAALVIEGTAETPAAEPTAGQWALLAAGFACSIPLQMAVWFAPVLVGWYGMPALKAMFFSFFACWRNRGAMAAFLLVLLVLGTGLTIAAAALIAAVVPQGQFAPLLLAPIPLLLLALTQASTFKMVLDVIDDRSEADLTAPSPASRPPAAAP
jgi:hypothetical protein